MVFSCRLPSGSGRNMMRGATDTGASVILETVTSGDESVPTGKTYQAEFLGAFCQAAVQDTVRNGVVHWAPTACADRSAGDGESSSAVVGTTEPGRNAIAATGPQRAQRAGQRSSGAS